MTSENMSQHQLIGKVRHDVTIIPWRQQLCKYVKNYELRQYVKGM